ncbi:transcriptional regulator [Dyella flagellata]|uniref:Transcriptional regulator n=1 Tax=Dyella flagellata TaxID=1867833 RepID=A0ABQ5XAI3_9GAMM|nr:transcriptional regulator [Dyella flagellata]GLQ88269.1 hypothetical protein GCM10007898_18380 [Dyella flagellata]
MALTVDYRETVAERIKKDPEFARALLAEAATLLVNGEAEAARLLMRDLTHGLVGFEGLAKETGRPSKSLHRMLAAGGNPGMDALASIFKALTGAMLHGKSAVVKIAEAA